MANTGPPPRTSLDLNLPLGTMSNFDEFDEWSQSVHPKQKGLNVITNNRVRFSERCSPSSENRLTLTPLIEHPIPRGHDQAGPNDIYVITQPVFKFGQPGGSDPMANSGCGTPFHATSFSYALPTAPGGSNRSETIRQDTNTISPLQTHFDKNLSLFSSHSSIYSDNEPQSAFPFPAPNASRLSSSRKRNIDKYDVDSDLKPPSDRMLSPNPRRRKPSQLDPNSARAIYLEKNRKAASKCRSKQKKQQEQLVETARVVERQNKMLKAEVELLRGDMRELMQLVGQHSHCPDARLRNYLQREADRLGAGIPGSSHEYSSLGNGTTLPER